jgi:hypothetical protein
MDQSQHQHAGRAAVPTRRQAADFWWRSRLLIALRAWRDLRGPRLPRWHTDTALADAPVRMQLRLPLWTDGREDEFVLVAGKVHNLRLAARAFDGIEVPAGECLSFWRQLGRPSARRGYVLGREVREGCVVPMIAGGICQLSNALATAAAHAGFELVERHGHTARIERAGVAQATIDATVFWNYVDLRIRAVVAWRLEVTLDADMLRLTIRTREVPAVLPSPRSAAVQASATDARPTARGCLSCAETACFRHRPKLRAQQARTAWLLDGCEPEWIDWLGSQPSDADRCLPWPPRQWLRGGSARGPWDALPAAAGAQIARFGWVALRRSWWLRRCAHDPGRRQPSVIDGQRWLAAAYACRLRPVHAHLVIDQGLLPHLQGAGVLGGRSYDVLAAALPMTEIQRRLDAALLEQSPAARATLADFRAEPALLAAELDALRGARRIVTAHAKVAAYWRRHGGVDVVQLPWRLPPAGTRRPSHSEGGLPLVVFPASALARKGAYELAQALRGRPCRLRVLGSPSDDAGLWQGLAVEQGSYAGDWLQRADVAVLPAHVEHAPRALLMALSAGIPVIASPACGVRGMAGLSLVPAGDVAALSATLSAVLDRPPVPPAPSSVSAADAPFP